LSNSGFSNRKIWNQGLCWQTLPTIFLCLDQAGQAFLLALQKEKLDFFKNSEAFASRFSIWAKITEDGWCGKLAANPGSLRVYLVGILGFVFKENRGCPGYLSRVELPVQRVANPQTRSVFDSRSALVYVELPKFKKIEAELVNQLDSWLYLLKHASKFSNVPDGLVGSVAASSLQALNYSTLTEEEAWSYEMSLKHYRDLLNVVDTAYQKAFEEGFQQGKLLAARQVAMNMLKDGKTRGKRFTIFEKVQLFLL